MNNSFDIASITSEVLEGYRKVTDPLADDTIAHIISSGYKKQVSEVFMTLMQNDSITADTFSSFDPELAKILTKYFEQTGDLPVWADMDLIKAGEKVFSNNGPEIFMLLNMSSLPLCYTCAKGAKVLYDTGRLLSHNKEIDPLARRLMETAQMIVNVMSPGGLMPTGKGHITIQKVRLIHASIRYYLKEDGYKGQPWDAEVYGEPINQEDLTGTLMSFGPVILCGLKQLGIQLSDAEQKAYMHCWKVVGYLMGIQDPLLPDTYEEGFELATRILKHQAAPSEQGEALTKSCIDFINYIIPGNSFDHLPNYLIDFFLKDFSNASGIDLAKCIGVQSDADNRDKIVLAITKYVIGKINGLEGNAFIQKITPVFNKMLLEGIIYHFNGGKDVHFSIPPSLQKNWGLAEKWTDHMPLTPDLLGNRLTWQKRKETLK